MNGAAFHTQMLIHYARIRSTGSPDNGFDLDTYTTTITTVINLYLSDLCDLMEKYKTYKKSTISFKQMLSRWPVIYPGTPVYSECVIVEGELNRASTIIKDLPVLSQDSKNECCKSSSNVGMYVDFMFSNYMQFYKNRWYFTGLKNNLKILIQQQHYLTLSL